ncbi:MAG: thioesterase family protein [Methylobacteriaceae bacterium]|nr:thioesterase family protein [Methylobacteriaceae bacterium]
MRVEPGWIDYNGHLNMAYYNVLFDRAIEEAWIALGMGSDYTAERNLTTFAAQAHLSYRREVGLIDAVRVTAQLIDYDEKRLHIYSEMRHAQEGWLAAISETLHLHVDLATRKVAPFPADIQAALAAMKAAHGRLPRPAELGATIGLRRPQSSAQRGRALN